MRKVTVLIIILMSAVFNVYANNWIGFNNSTVQNEKPEVNLINQNQIDAEFYGFIKKSSTISDTIYQEIKFPGNNALTSDIGFPQLPIKTLYIEVDTDTPTITINTSKYYTIDNYNILPAQIQPFDTSNDSIAFEKNYNVYNNNSYYPNSIAKISTPLTIRDHKISILTFLPIQFNPVTKQLKVYTSIDITVNGAATISLSKDNIAFSSLLKENVINYEISQTRDVIQDLLIITPDMFYADLLPLKEWKESIGFRTKIATQSEITNLGYNWIADPTIDNIYEGINAYIKNAYDNWGDEAPEFLLLVGDENLLPSHSCFSSGEYYVSDLYYTTMDLSNLPPSVDWIFDFPDISYSRIPVNTANELQTVIDKIIRYENTPYIGNSSWLKTLVFAACFEDGTGTGDDRPADGVDDSFFIETSEILSDFIVSENYYSNKIYCESNTQSSFEPEYYYFGDPIPSDLTFNGDTQDVINSFNNGGIIVTHRDHGVERGWLHPDFRCEDVSSIINGDKLPVVFSINCRSGSFNYTADCLGETLLKKHNGGAVGFIGATNPTRSGYNDELSKGLFDAIWQDFDEEYNSNPSNNSINNLGSILNYAKLWMFDKYIVIQGAGYNPDYFDPDNEHARAQFEKFHFLGDPTLEIWTGVPKRIYADIDYNLNSIVALDYNNIPIDDAKVVFRNATEYQVTFTNEFGEASCSFQFDDVSIVKHNYFPSISHVLRSNEILNNQSIKSDIIIPAGRALNLSGNIDFQSRYRIINYGNLVIASNSIITGQKDKVIIGEGNQQEFNGNRIDVYGSITIGDNVQFVSESETSWEGLFLYDTNNLSLENPTFENCTLIAEDTKVTVDNGTFTNSWIKQFRSDLIIENTSFNDSFIYVNGIGGDPTIDRKIVIGNCNFDNQLTFTSIYISTYTDFEITNSVIDSKGTAIDLFESGKSGIHTIKNNIIFDSSQNTNSNFGIKSYHSYVDIIGANNIYSKSDGISGYQNSEIKLLGSDTGTSQSIHENSRNEVTFSHDSFPAIFHYNNIYDDNHDYSLVKCYDHSSYTPCRQHNITYNDWGTSFDYLLDFFPSDGFLYNPQWTSSSVVLTGTEILFNQAKQAEVDEDFVTASQIYKSIIELYPESEFAKSSAKELLALEQKKSTRSTDFLSLKQYYETEPNLQLYSDNQQLASDLANYCDIEMGNYINAISYYEDIISNPATVQDSICAIIDVGYTYLLLESEGRNSYTGRFANLKPRSVKEFEASKDALLKRISENENEPFNNEEIKIIELGNNYPNPFNPTTTISFSIPTESKVDISIYNIKGQKVKTVLNETLEKGNHQAIWNGVDNLSKTVSSGVYFYKLSVNGKPKSIKKCLLLK